MLAFDFSRLYSGFKIHTLMNKNVYESYTSVGAYFMLDFYGGNVQGDANFWIGL